MKKTALALLAAAAVGCSSSAKTQEQPQPRIEDSHAASSTADKPQAAPASQGEGEPIAITIKKGDKHTPEAAYKGDPPPGYVCFDFKSLDMEKVALPLFSKQAGVVVEYGSKVPRTVSLALNQPVPWRDALVLICRFTGTHVTRSQIPGRLEIKDGFNDPTPLLAKFDPDDKRANDSGIGVIGPDGKPVEGVHSTQTIGGSPGNQSSTSSGGGGSTDPSEGYRDPSQGYNDKVDEIRKGVSTTNSGGR